MATSLVVSYTPFDDARMFLLLARTHYYNAYHTHARTCTPMHTRCIAMRPGLFSYTNVTPDTFAVEHNDPSGRTLRMMEKYSLGGGLIVYVCRFYSDHLTLTLSITNDGKHVAQSPYKLRNVFSDYCSCPFRSPQQWQSDYECPLTDPQIVEDLEPFKSGINVSELSQRGVREYHGWSFIHYSIIGNKVCQDRHPVVLETH